MLRGLPGAAAATSIDRNANAANHFTLHLMFNLVATLPLTLRTARAHTRSSCPQLKVPHLTQKRLNSYEFTAKSPNSVNVDMTQSAPILRNHIAAMHWIASSDTFLGD